MPTLDEHSGSRFAKLLFIGDSGSGKTGALIALLRAGYKLKILDLDNGLDVLRIMARKEGVSLKDVEYFTFQDKYHPGPNGQLVIKGKPTAFPDSMKKLTEWSQIEDDKTVFVLDTLSAMGKQSYEWAKFMNPTAKDGRNWYGAGQMALEDVLAVVTGDDFKMNVVVNSHVNYREVAEGIPQKGYATALGNALGPKIPKYFNTLLVAEVIGTGVNIKRKIRTAPTGLVDAKVPGLEAELGPELPLNTGLATVFEQLKLAA